MQVIITMAGSGQRFKNAGYSVTKPLVQIAGQSMLEHQLEIFPSDWTIFLACSAEVSKEIPETIRRKTTVVEIQPTERGPLDTVLQILPNINEDEVIISYCDYSILWDADDFLQMIDLQNSDAAIVSFQGFHPTYLGANTYCHLLVDQKNQTITNLQEKKLYTGDIFREWTSCGLYYFKSKSFLQSCLDQQVKQDLKHIGGEYYISLAIKAMMNVSKIKVSNYEISYFYQFGTPEDCERADYWWKFFNSQTDKYSDFPYGYRFIAQGRRPGETSVFDFAAEREYWKKFFIKTNH